MIAIGNFSVTSASLYRWAVDCHSLTAQAKQRLTIGALALGLTACGGLQQAETWRGDCPTGNNPPPAYVTFIELSASERSADIIDDRLDKITDQTREALDCEASLSVILLEAGQPVTLFEEPLDSPLNTEQARDLQVIDDADAIVNHVRTDIEQRLDNQPPTGSDPAAMFRVLDEIIRRFPNQQGYRVQMLSDGISETDTINLNQPLTIAETEELKAQVAPDVSFGIGVEIDWSGIGQTTDEQKPPSEWIDLVVNFWFDICDDQVPDDSCVVTNS